MLSKGILEIGKNYLFNYSFPFSADVKTTVNKNLFDFM